MSYVSEVSSDEAPTVLIVDNNQMSIMRLREVFRKRGFATEICEDGDVAVDEYIKFVRSAQPADPEQPVDIPGDPERKARKNRRKSGLPLSQGAWESILDAAAEWNLNREDLSKMALISS